MKHITLLNEPVDALQTTTLTCYNTCDGDGTVSCPCNTHVCGWENECLGCDVGCDVGCDSCNGQFGEYGY